MFRPDMSLDIEKSMESLRDNELTISTLIITLLELLKKKEPELCLPSLRKLEARRECPRHP
jgi:hypothetical protein